MSRPTFDDVVAGRFGIDPISTVQYALPDGSVGVLMRGHTMGPIRDGWILFYQHLKRAPTDALIDELCVIQTEDGRRLVRYLRKSPAIGMYDLLTFTGQPEMNVRLVWAEPVLLIKPHKLTDEERAGMVRLSEVLADF